MKIENIEIIKIKPYGKNAKLHPQSQIDNVAESISQFGWQQPIVVDKDFVIIIGHCRYLAAQKLGLLDVPCVVADSLSEEQVKKLRLIDNKTNESDWDFDLLKTELGDLDLSGFSLDWGIMEDPAEIKEDDDFDIDAAKPINPASKLGDIYLLGNHRLMCGDSTNDDDVNKLMDGCLADLLFTDPPYNVNVSNEEGLTILNDNLKNNEFQTFLDKAFHCAYNSLKDGGGSIYG